MDENQSASDSPSGLLRRKRVQREQIQQLNSASAWLMHGVLSIFYFILRLDLFFLFFQNFSGTFMLLLLSQVVQALSLIYQLRENRLKISSPILFILLFFFGNYAHRIHGHLSRSLGMLPVLLSIDSFLLVQFILSTSQQGSSQILAIIAWSVASLANTLHQGLEKYPRLSSITLFIEAAGLAALNNTTIFLAFICIRNMKLLLVPLSVLLFLALKSSILIRKFLMCGYKHDSIKTSQNGLLSIFFAQLLLYNGPLKHFQQIPFEKQLEAKMRLVYCIRGVFLILLFGITFSDIIILDNKALLHTLGSYVMILSISLWNKVQKMRKYLQLGPYYRLIEVNCKEIQNCSQEQINQEYCNFKPKQKWVEFNVNQADIQCLNKVLAIIHEEICNQSRFLQGEISQKFSSSNLHGENILHDKNNPNSRVKPYRHIKVSMFTPGYLHNHLLFKPETSACDINLHSIDSLLFSVFDLLENQFKLPTKQQWIRHLHITRKFSISTAQNLKIFQSILERAYSLIPYVIVPKRDLFHPIKLLQIQILKIIALNITVRPFLSFMPEQVYYDLFSESSI